MPYGQRDLNRSSGPTGQASTSTQVPLLSCCRRACIESQPTARQAAPETSSSDTVRQQRKIHTSTHLAKKIISIPTLRSCQAWFAHCFPMKCNNSHQLATLCLVEADCQEHMGISCADRHMTEYVRGNRRRTDKNSLYAFGNLFLATYSIAKQYCWRIEYLVLRTGRDSRKFHSKKQPPIDSKKPTAIAEISLPAFSFAIYKCTYAAGRYTGQRNR